MVRKKARDDDKKTTELLKLRIFWDVLPCS